jgi:hypothetical protein
MSAIQIVCAVTVPLLSAQHKIKFSFLNGNLIVPARQPFILRSQTFPMIGEHMAQQGRVAAEWSGR